MYHKAYGIIETLAPLHIGASAGEETGNLNLIFRDQFTQTGIIPGSSIRGRFRADMRSHNRDLANDCYGHEAQTGNPNSTTEALIKFEYASLVWFPVFCPGQPIVWVSSPLLLKRYKQIASIQAEIPKPYTAHPGLQARPIPETNQKVLFFNLGFLSIEHEVDLSAWIPPGTDLSVNQLVVVHDKDISMLHDMGLYRQSRVKLLDDMKKVDTKIGAFFNVEALPVGSILAFPIALKQKGWHPFGEYSSNTPYSRELYFGGLESIGFGRCNVTLAGEAFN
ncbi:type III-B CRISPR module RAMP protein Cmr4 [Scytonema sp. UIC 10036]|uniref:RAMP superfamily CRISPR-associated protein n=1 Tax=Scytonema sp. UIC 10036 TaxID=2304196 RepID=UPI0012DA1FDA|nr:RAMP superfamily CRISPR-associated protein [Scytonema sp. UIC 10036]MUG97242.1 type III-B CRISPR module RAMP protein Cmr4 [Scytonema sp. UIC 10036]